MNDEGKPAGASAEEAKPRLRELDSHKAPGLGEAITIRVLDQPGAGGACHVYEVGYRCDCEPDVIRFQEGPPAAGVNGISMEALLAIVEDRLAGFQTGPGECDENAHALGAVRGALDALHHRTWRLHGLLPSTGTVHQGIQSATPDGPGTGEVILDSPHPQPGEVILNAPTGPPADEPGGAEESTSAAPT